MTTCTIVLRDGGALDDPLGVVLAFLAAYRIDVGEAPPASFGEADVRLANRGGARIAAAEAAAMLERRRAIERALRAIAPDATLAGPESAVPWPPLRRLFDAFADIRGVGFSKVTKALHPKRPGLVPILDSFVHAYLVDDDPGRDAPFGERALALVRGYKRELDRNRVGLRSLRRELDGRGHELTEVRILDLLIWSVAAGAS